MRSDQVRGVSRAEGRSVPGALVVALIVTAALPQGGAAQTTDFGPRRPTPHTYLWGGVRLVESTLDEATAPATALNVSTPVFTAGLSFVGWRFVGRLRAGYGRQSGDPAAGTGDLSVTELELLAWSDLLLTDGPTQLMLSFPIGFSYRRLGLDDSPVAQESLSMFRMGIGGGLGLRARLGERVALESRAAPLLILPIAKQQQEVLIPQMERMLEGELVLHLERVLGRRQGISLGIAARRERLAVPHSELFPDVPPDQEWLHFDGTDIAFRVGIHW